MKFTKLLNIALAKAGKQEALATILDLSPSALSKRINNEIGWAEKEINHLLEYVEAEITFQREYSKKIETLKDAIKILLDEKQ